MIFGDYVLSPVHNTPKLLPLKDQPTMEGRAEVPSPGGLTWKDGGGEGEKKLAKEKRTGLAA